LPVFLPLDTESPIANLAIEVPLVQHVEFAGRKAKA
jgi:hypothetical protein